eukprot:TRINITY_DN20630_c0_g1::TRINITY_DN20630_c0_g1_i1::g.12362::m.12362 TRINITY_DN20630_c0_g1::TRINITY_DN20630_c0_g1_i1::g.12362  ORF type:complete len:104 (-),score=-0.10,Sigma54_activ_2/PF14532.1/0.0045 TRINITY_DN20630_c0_g1_i1:106-417(-)
MGSITQIEIFEKKKNRIFVVVKIHSYQNHSQVGLHECMIVSRDGAGSHVRGVTSVQGQSTDQKEGNNQTNKMFFSLSSSHHHISSYQQRGMEVLRSPKEREMN